MHGVIYAPYCAIIEATFKVHFVVWLVHVGVVIAVAIVVVVVVAAV